MRAAVRIRAFCKRDLEDVLFIQEIDSERTGVAVPPISHDVWGYVAVDRDDDILAYCFFRCDSGSVVLLDFATHPRHRRQGYGRELLHKVRKLVGTSEGRLVAEVAEADLQTQLFLRACGLEARVDGAVEGHYLMEYRAAKGLETLTTPGYSAYARICSKL